MEILVVICSILERWDVYVLAEKHSYAKKKILQITDMPNFAFFWFCFKDVQEQFRKLKYNPCDFFFFLIKFDLQIATTFWHANTQLVLWWQSPYNMYSSLPWLNEEKWQEILHKNIVNSTKRAIIWNSFLVNILFLEELVCRSTYASFQMFAGNASSVIETR